MRKATIALLALVTFVAGAPGAQAWPGCEQDRVRAVVSGDTLTVHHADAVYNCCMDGCEYTVTQTDSTIQIVEMEVLTNPCACVCCYDLSVQITDLAPGDFTLIFRWYDFDTGQWEEWSEPVSGSGPGGTPVVTKAVSSGCLDPTPVSEGVEGGSWGRVKSLYE